MQISSPFGAHTSEADCGAFCIDPDTSRPGIPSLIVLVYTSTRRVVDDFVHVLHHDLGREDCLNRRRNYLDRRRQLLPATKNQSYPTLGGPSTIELASRFHHDLIEFLSVWCVIWRFLCGARCLSKRPCEGLILTQPRVLQIRRYFVVAIRFCGHRLWATSMTVKKGHRNTCGMQRSSFLVCDITKFRLKVFFSDRFRETFRATGIPAPVTHEPLHPYTIGWKCRSTNMPGM